MLEEVSVIAPDDIWAVGHKYVPAGTGMETQTLAMHWDGASWTIVPSPSPSPYPGGGWADFLTVHAVTTDDVWAAGGAVIQAPDGFVGTHLMVQHWDGSQWSVVPAPITIGGSGNFVDDIEVIAADDIWFVGDWLEFPAASAAEKRALAMHWDGSGLTVHETPFFDNGSIGGHGLTAVSAISSDDIWAVGGGHDGDYVTFSYIVHWDGQQWEHVPGPTAGWYHRLYDVQAVSSNEVYAVGDYQDASGYHGMILRWNGASWQRLSDPPVGGASIEVLGPGQVYVGGSGVALWDGASWSVVATFPGVNGPAIWSLEPNGPCSLWGSGRAWSASDMVPLTVRLDPDSGVASYCTAGVSASGCQVTLSASGVPSATSPSGFVVSAAGVEGSKDGLFYFGSNGRQANPWGNGTSFQCVVPPLTRASLLVGSGTTGLCDGALSQDLNALWAAKPTKNPGAGALVQAQLWYRDPLSTSNQTTSLSDAVEFTVAP
jgi:hypothetical protein